MTTQNRELASLIDNSGNVTATGNLTVSGTTTAVSSTNTTVTDPLMELNNGAGSNSNDLGFVFERGSTGDNACLIWDESNDAFAVGTTTATGSSTGNMSYTTGDFLAGKVTVDNVIINGTTIGHTDDTDLMTLADGGLTVAGTIASTGVVTANAGVVVDNITIDGAEFDVSTGDFKFDIEGDLRLDANGGDLIFQDNGTDIGSFTNSSSDFVITSAVQDKDIVFKGDDNGSAITALTLDMSDAGAATFNNKIVATELDISGNVDIDGVLETDNLTVGGSQGSDGEVLTSTGSGVAWEAVSAGPTFKTFGTNSIMIGDNATGTIDAANNNTGVGVDVFAALTTGDNNTVMGKSAGDALTTGQGNTAIGHTALTTSDTADNNTALGRNALSSTTDGHSNVAVGKSAGYSNTSGDYNIAIGVNAGQGSTGNNNVSVGHEAGKSDGSTAASDNVAVGFKALTAVTSGQNNVTMGSNAGLAIQDGEQSIFIGTNAGHKIVSHDDNICIGTNSGYEVVSGASNVYIGSKSGGYGASSGAANGSNNVAVGEQTLYTSTGSNNTAIGHNALRLNENGAGNTAVGYQSGDGITSGSYNTALGYNCLSATVTADANTAVGNSVMVANTSGTKNVAVGQAALDANTSGSNIVAIGVDALGSCTDGGGDNVAVGTEALASTNGTRNLAIGYRALTAQSGSADNLAIGYQALLRQTTGANGNIAIGNNCGRGVVSSASTSQLVAIGHEVASHASSALAGYQNVFIGYNIANNANLAGAFMNTIIGGSAGTDLTTGDENVFLGYKAGEESVGTDSGGYNCFIGAKTRGTHASHSQAIAIGHDIDAAPGQVAIGTGASGKVYNEFNTDNAWSQGSDERLKQNIKDSTLGLEFINDLRPVTYQWKPSNELPEEWYLHNEENGRDTDTIMTGLIAQEVKEAIDKSGVERFGGWDEDNDGIQQIKKELFIFPLINAVKELTAKVKELEKKLEG